MPFVGHLFSQQRNTTVKNELVILLKPMIMGPDGLPEATSRSQQRFDQFRHVLDNSYSNEDGDKEGTDSE